MAEPDEEVVGGEVGTADNARAVRLQHNGLRSAAAGWRGSWLRRSPSEAAKAKATTAILDSARADIVERMRTDRKALAQARLEMMAIFGGVASALAYWLPNLHAQLLAVGEQEHVSNQQSVAEQEQVSKQESVPLQGPTGAHVVDTLRDRVYGSYEELADTAGVSIDRIKRMAAGKRVPSLSIRETIAQLARESGLFPNCKAADLLPASKKT